METGGMGAHKNVQMSSSLVQIAQSNLLCRVTSALFIFRKRFMLGFPDLSWNHVSPLFQRHTSGGQGLLFWYPFLSPSGQELKTGSNSLGWLPGGFPSGCWERRREFEAGPSEASLPVWEKARRRVTWQEGCVN